MTPSYQQSQALKAVADWYAKSDSQVFYLGGFAGTGKSTLATHFATGLSRVDYCAFTGKAALVMQRKGCLGASTIHSAIYICKRDRGIFSFELNPDSAIKDSDLVIVDECSMVSAELGIDLLSFGTKVLVLGDPAQLPPVDGAGYFTSRSPDFMLTEIHRQAAENPIIRASMAVREGRGLRLCSVGKCKVVRSADLNWGRVLSAGQVLCGTNRTRKRLNEQIRKLRGLPKEVTEGDKVICLKNSHPRGLLNGGMWSVSEIRYRDPAVEMVVDPIDAGVSPNPQLVRVNPLFFQGREDELDWRVRQHSDEFAFGDAITVHKSQGSQWDSVVVFDESEVFREEAVRHLYTAVTRAAEKLIVVTEHAAPPARAVYVGGL